MKQENNVQKKKDKLEVEKMLDYLISNIFGTGENK